MSATGSDAGSAHGQAPAEIIGDTPAIRAVRAAIERLGPTDLSVVVGGETGTGKELVAAGLHAASGRPARGGRFVPVNCAAIPEHLIESELFGHARGAFTGAELDKPGLIEEADGGTLFLDEIAELLARLQPKVLRALDSGEVRRVGATRARRIDFRLVAASNKPLMAEIEKGTLREDLFYRISQGTLKLPPLRARRADIPLLVRHFLGDHPVTSAALELLEDYHWPGNVRDLLNALEYAGALSDGSEIEPEHLPDRIRMAGTAASTRGLTGPTKLRPLRDVERDHVIAVYESVGRNGTRAAEILVIDPKTLRRKLKGYRERGELA